MQVHFDVVTLAEKPQALSTAPTLPPAGRGDESPLPFRAGNQLIRAFAEEQPQFEGLKRPRPSTPECRIVRYEGPPAPPSEHVDRGFTHVSVQCEHSGGAVEHLLRCRYLLGDRARDFLRALVQRFRRGTPSGAGAALPCACFEQPRLAIDAWVGMPVSAMVFPMLVDYASEGRRNLLLLLESPPPGEVVFTGERVRASQAAQRKRPVIQAGPHTFTLRGEDVTFTTQDTLLRACARAWGRRNPKTPRHYVESVWFQLGTTPLRDCHTPENLGLAPGVYEITVHYRLDGGGKRGKGGKGGRGGKGKKGSRTQTPLPTVPADPGLPDLPPLDCGVPPFRDPRPPVLCVMAEFAGTRYGAMTPTGWATPLVGAPGTVLDMHGRRYDCIREGIELIGYTPGCPGVYKAIEVSDAAELDALCDECVPIISRGPLGVRTLDAFGDQPAIQVVYIRDIYNGVRRKYPHLAISESTVNALMATAGSLVENLPLALVTSTVELIVGERMRIAHSANTSRVLAKAMGRNRAFGHSGLGILQIGTDQCVELAVSTPGVMMCNGVAIRRPKVESTYVLDERLCVERISIEATCGVVCVGLETTLEAVLRGEGNFGSLQFETIGTARYGYSTRGFWVTGQVLPAIYERTGTNFMLAMGKRIMTRRGELEEVLCDNQTAILRVFEPEILQTLATIIHDRPDLIMAKHPPAVHDAFLTLVHQADIQIDTPGDLGLLLARSVSRRLFAMHGLIAGTVGGVVRPFLRALRALNPYRRRAVVHPEAPAAVRPGWRPPERPIQRPPANMALPQDGLSVDDMTRIRAVEGLVYIAGVVRVSSSCFLASAEMAVGMWWIGALYALSEARWLYAHEAVKKALYLLYHAEYVDSLLHSVTVPEVEVKINLKPDENSKPNKPGRTTADLGNNVLAAGFLLPLVKKMLFNRLYDLSSLFPGEEQFHVYVAGSLPENVFAVPEPGHNVATIFSDDCTANIGGRMLDVDISSCDSSNTYAIFMLLAYVLHMLYVPFFLLKIFFAPTSAPAVARNPENPREYIRFRPVLNFEWSGWVGTTILNKISSLLIVCALFHRYNTLTPKEKGDLTDAEFEALMKEAAQAVGFVITAVVRTEPAAQQFLKHSPLLCENGERVLAVNLGTFFRGFGEIIGELEAKHIGVRHSEFREMCLSERWERRMSALVQGMKNEPSCPVMMVLRRRFPSRGFASERYTVCAFDRSRHVIGYAGLIERYGCGLHEWQLLVEQLESLKFTQVITSPVVTAILAVDYGY